MRKYRCNAAGPALDPLIVFNWKNMQSTWRGEKRQRETFYAVSDSGQWKYFSSGFVYDYDRFATLFHCTVVISSV